MCGRFVVTTDPALLAVRIGAVDETGGRVGSTNYNVAPTTTIAAVVARHDEPRHDDEPQDRATRRVRSMRWGLLPPWVKADAEGRPKAKSLLINARAETLTSSPAFRASARAQRCLVPMDGYYEWRPSPDPGPKTPFYMSRRDGAPILVAGLWSAWRPDENAAPILTCTIVTTDAVGDLGEIHHRMPLMLDENSWDRWLNPDDSAPEDLLAMRPDISGIAIRKVSRLVNRVANNSAELLEPA
ncbi:MAG: SOS response-associated peptidase [Mycobacteriaceae bacterium]|jgi:putative SOS response-associated peptidase YedK